MNKRGTADQPFIVLEKEAAASGVTADVLHSGISYDAGPLKGTLCTPHERVPVRAVSVGRSGR